MVKGKEDLLGISEFLLAIAGQQTVVDWSHVIFKSLLHRDVSITLHWAIVMPYTSVEVLSCKN